MSISQKSEAHIWVIVVLVFIILLVHTMPMIADSIKSIKDLPPPIPKKSFDLEPIDIKLKQKKGRKYYNVFEEWHLSDLLASITESKEIETPKNLVRFGSSCTFMENEEITNNLEKLFCWDVEHKIYIVKAENGHKIDWGQLVMIDEIDGVLKEVKSIWYIYINLDWKFENKWTFKDNNNNYYVPENNTIIEFQKDDTYEQYPLVCDFPKYFIIVYNF